MELINPLKSPTLTIFSLNISLSKLKPSSPSLTHFPFQPPFSTPSRFKLYAQFRQPTKRQNYLRKKLTEQQQVSKNSIFYKPSLSNIIEKKISTDDNSDHVNVNDVIELKTKKKLLSNSVLWNEFENWVEQYKRDTEFWGIGTAPIFTVYQESQGEVERVEVNEDEILRRSGSEDVDSKISYAKDIAKEMESGNNMLPKNSSVVKFVVSGAKSGFVNVTQGGKSGFVNVVTRFPGLFPKMKMSRLGVAVLVGLVVVSAVTKLFKGEEDKGEYTMLEKEMLRRKLSARAEREKMVKDVSVEVVQESAEPEHVAVERPKLDREELMKNIIKAKGSKDILAIEEDHSGKSEQFSDKIREIREMARHAREIENGDVSSGTSSVTNSNVEDVKSENGLSNEKEVAREHRNGSISSQVNFSDEIPMHIEDDTLPTSPMTSSDDLIERSDTGIDIHVRGSIEDVGSSNQNLLTRRANEVDQQQSDSRASKPSLRSSKMRLRVISSVSEAKEYLSRKHEKIHVDLEPKARNAEPNDTFLTMPSERIAVENTENKIDRIEKVFDDSMLTENPDLTNLSQNTAHKEEGYILTNKSYDEAGEVGGGKTSENGKPPSLSHEGSHTTQINETDENNTTLIDCEDLELEKKSLVPEEKIYCENTEEGKNLIDSPIPGSSVDHEKNIRCEEMEPSPKAENWMEKNFHEFDPIIKKMGVSFRDNYLAAKEKINQDLNSKPEMIQLNMNGDESELDWMKDEKLSDIVFKVRDNELAGRDPFHLMNEKDKLAFFNGLENKVEQENKKLLNLHEYLHSNIENLDYGADGISLHDPPEKFIPRWKGPPIDKISDLVSNSTEQKIVALAENDDTIKSIGQDSIKKPEDIIPSPSDAPGKSSKTIIQGSDGSIRAGKSKGKEFWQHTKKWSQGFMDCYNAETDPEMKGIMKDMGKDLDRWITEKEIKEAAELMDKLPEKGKKFIKDKLDKVRREVELFGPQAVVSKYREYGDEKEEDYLWWLDLPYVMCIELYTEEDGEERVGLYSLEMAPDLELSPKPFHVIAFEDVGDCKSLCYIIQHHMEMLGNGNAFVIARPPKDAFREAKANGFSVTVIRKGEMQLNVDQTLEEVEELITEIGSKIYHDSIMRERNVDISALMKGVFGLKKPTRRRRSKRKRKKPTKS